MVSPAQVDALTAEVLVSLLVSCLLERQIILLAKDRQRRAALGFICASAWWFELNKPCMTEIQIDNFCAH